MAKAEVKINLDLSKYVDVYSNVLRLAVGNQIVNVAKNKVRTDSGNLKNSIRTEISRGKLVVFSQTEYAAAQEFGRPDLPNYGFTPYMRPAAREVLEGGTFRVLTQLADRIARSRSKI